MEIEKMEKGIYKITTASGSNYTLEKNDNEEWEINFRGGKYKIKGFATWPVWPEDLAYQPPEAIEGYEIKADPAINTFVLFAEHIDKDDPNKGKFWNTNKIASIERSHD